jgi:nucleotide-binding universal stress UspA family protein
VNVLAALDGSEGAFAALRTACRIAARSPATVTALWVNKGQEYTPEETGWSDVAERIARELESVGRRVVEEAHAIGRAEGTEVATVVAHGVPAAAILNYVYDHGIVTLVALGHGSGTRAAEGFVASTARTVATWAKVPVLVTSSAVGIRRVVLAVDDPEPSRKAAAFAATLAGMVGAQVRVLSVVPSAEAVIALYRHVGEVPGISRYVEESQRAYDRMGEEASSLARGVLDSMNVRADAITRKGRPAEEILAEAGEDELLVIGLRSGPSGRRFGAVANRLLGTRSATVVFV